MTTTLSQRDFHRFERMAVRMFRRIQDKTFAVLTSHQNGTTLTMRQDDGILSLRVDCNVTESMILSWSLVKEAAVNRDGFIELDRDDTQIIMKHEVGGIPRQSRFSVKNLEAPDQMTDVATEPLLGALVACGKCIDRDSDRYALGYIAFNGKNGTVAASSFPFRFIDGFCETNGHSYRLPIVPLYRDLSGESRDRKHPATAASWAGHLVAGTSVLRDQPGHEPSLIPPIDHRFPGCHW